MSGSLCLLLDTVYWRPICRRLITCLPPRSICEHLHRTVVKFDFHKAWRGAKLTCAIICGFNHMKVKEYQGELATAELQMSSTLSLTLQFQTKHCGCWQEPCSSGPRTTCCLSDLPCFIVVSLFPFHRPSMQKGRDPLLPAGQSAGSSTWTLSCAFGQVLSLNFYCVCRTGDSHVPPLRCMCRSRHFLLSWGVWQQTLRRILWSVRFCGRRHSRQLCCLCWPQLREWVSRLQ